MTDDFYKILRVAKTASAGEIQKAYRELARENHPDRFQYPNAPPSTHHARIHAYSVRWLQLRSGLASPRAMRISWVAACA